MAVISNLDVNLNARTRKFDGPIKKSEKTFSSFTRRIGSFSGAKLAGVFGIVAGGVASFVGLAAAMRKTNEQFEKLDELSKFADSVGASVSEMQALNLQAELTGTSTATLNKGTQRFVRMLGDLENGSAQAQSAFGALNLTASSFDGLTLSQQIGLVSDRINEQPNAAMKASAAYDVFGRQGQELMTFFAGGSEGIQAVTDDINAFGVALTRTDTAQIELANDSWTKMSVLTEGIFQKLAVEAAPIMTAIVELATDGAKEFGGLGGIIEWGFDLLVDGIGFGIDGFNVLSGSVNQWRGYLMQVIASAVKGFETINSYVEKFTGIELDFGMKGLGDELQREANRFANTSREQLLDGFAGLGSAAFKDRIEKVKLRAVEIAENAPTTPPVPTGPTFGEMIQKGQAFAGNLLESISNGIASFEMPEIQMAGAAAAVSAGNAQTTINQIQAQNRQAELAKRQITEAETTNQFLASAVTSLKKLVGKSGSSQVKL